MSVSQKHMYHIFNMISYTRAIVNVSNKQTEPVFLNYFIHFVTIAKKEPKNTLIFL